MVVEALAGFAFGITADRRWEEQATLLTRRGARVVHGPAIKTLPLSDSPELERATREVLAFPPDIVVLTTGLGARGWFATAASAGHDDALRRALNNSIVVARGPKAAGAAITNNVHVAWRAPSERSDELVSHLGDVHGRRIAVQRDGASTPVLAETLRGRGAHVVDVPVYRWALPDDLAPAVRLIDAACSGQLDGVTFTSSPAVTNLLAIAATVDRSSDLLDAFASGMLAICVGPVCAETARARGVTAPIAPEPGRLGAMIRVVEKAFEGRAHRVEIDGTELVIQGASVVVDGERHTLSDRERAVLDALVVADGAVVGKDDLLRSVWGAAGDAHVVEVTIARLRTRLGAAGNGIVTVPRRGYRLTR